MASRELVWPAAWFTVGGIALGVTVGAQVYLSSDADFARDGWAIVLPWIVVTVAGVLALVVPRRIAVLLLASAAAIAVRYCGPLAMMNLLHGQAPALFWGTEGIPREAWVQDIVDGRNSMLTLVLLAQAAACIPLAIGVVHLAVELWQDPARSRRWDAVLVPASIAFGLACLVLAPYGATGHVSLSNVAEYAANSFLLFLALSWVIPLSAWTLLHVGRSGWESVSGAAGLVVAVLVIPVSVDALARLLGGYTSIYAYPGDQFQDYDVPASSVLDVYGFWWYVPAAAVLLLAVAVVRYLVAGRRSVDPAAAAPDEDVALGL